MKIKGRYGWWLQDTSFTASCDNATEIATMNECKQITRRLLDVPSMEPDDIIIVTDDSEEISAGKFFCKVHRWTLLSELPKINLGGKGKNLNDAKTRLDNGDTIYVNGCEVWASSKYYHWEHYGSSANRKTLEDLRFIFKTIAKSADYAFSVVPDNLGVFEVRAI